MAQFLAIDLGTTNIRSIMFDERGRVLGQAFRKVTTFNPKSEIAVQDPEEVWKLTVETMRESVKASHISTEDISAISFSARMHGTMLLKRDGTPLTHLFTWLDRRASSQVETISQTIDPYDLYQRTGCPLLFIYPFAKLFWMKENIPQKLESCSKVLSAKDYVIFKLTGNFYTDRSLASGTQLLNIHSLDWDETLLAMVDLDADKLPSLVNETEVVGELSREIARTIGLRRGIPLIVGASDGALNNIGLGATARGIAAMNIGTSGAIRILSERPFIDTHRAAHFFCYYAGFGSWLPGGAISNAGNLLRWFRDNLGHQEVVEAENRGVDPYEVILERAASIEPGAEGLLLLPFFSGERFPIRDPKARGVLFGLTLRHGKGHIARAILESVVFTLRWIMESLQEHSAIIREIRVGGGGARSSVWRQIQADVLGKPVVHTRVEESSALGAAMLAAIGLGIYEDLKSASKNMIETVARQEPDLQTHTNYQRSFEMYKDYYYASRKFFEKL